MAERKAKTKKVPGPLRVGVANTFPRVRRALCRITEAVLAGTITPDVAGAAIRGLNAVGWMLRQEVIEAGLRELEARAGERNDHDPSSVAYQELVGIRKRKVAREMLQ